MRTIVAFVVLLSTCTGCTHDRFEATDVKGRRWLIDCVPVIDYPGDGKTGGNPIDDATCKAHYWPVK